MLPAPLQSRYSKSVNKMIALYHISLVYPFATSTISSLIFIRTFWTCYSIHACNWIWQYSCYSYICLCYRYCYCYNCLWWVTLCLCCCCCYSLLNLNDCYIDDDSMRRWIFIMLGGWIGLMSGALSFVIIDLLIGSFLSFLIFIRSFCVINFVILVVFIVTTLQVL